MKFFKPFTIQGFLFGVGIAVVTSALAPAIKKNTRSLAVKGTEGVIMAGNKMSNMKETMSDKVSNFGTEQETEVIEQKKFNDLYEEIKKERKEIKRLTSEINNIKSNMANKQNEA